MLGRHSFIPLPGQWYALWRRFLSEPHQWYALWRRLANGFSSGTCYGGTRSSYCLANGTRSGGACWVSLISGTRSGGAWFLKFTGEIMVAQVCELQLGWSHLESSLASMRSQKSLLLSVRSASLTVTGCASDSSSLGEFILAQRRIPCAPDSSGLGQFNSALGFPTTNQSDRLPRVLCSGGAREPHY